MEKVSKVRKTSAKIIQQGKSTVSDNTLTPVNTLESQAAGGSRQQTSLGRKSGRIRTLDQGFFIARADSGKVTELMDAHAWLKLDEAASRARCSPKIIYRETRDGRLRHARVGNRLRFLPSWIDEWLIATAQPQAPVADVPAICSELTRG